jgi:ATP/maltotriose-dependent transcriptional regulator MalT
MTHDSGLAVRELAPIAPAPPRSRMPHPLTHALPALPADLVAIPALEQALDAALEARVVCVSAPAGFGKTVTLLKLHALHAQHGRALCWVDLRCPGDDPLHLLRALGAAVAGARPGHGAAPVVDDGASAGELAAAVRDQLAGNDDGLVVFIDDYQQVAHEAVHQCICWLLEHGAPGVRFVLASRQRLPFKLSKLRLARQLVEFDSTELRMGPAEGAALLAAASARVLDAAHARVLCERTEGWVAGLLIAGQALRQHPDPDHFVQTFSGADRDIAAYLAEVVIAPLPAPLLEFLMKSALVGSFSVEFCREVLGEAAADRSIARVMAHQLFLAPMDRQETWYRYHGLFADCLKKRFVQAEPERAARLLQSASRWCERRGAIHDAITHALAARDAARAAELIGQCVHQSVQLRGDHRPLLSWMATLPRSYVESDPRIQRCYLWALMLAHRRAEAEHEFAAIECAIAQARAGTPPPALAAMERNAQMMRCAFYALNGTAASAREHSNAWLARWQGDCEPHELGIALCALGHGAYIAQDYQQALAAAASAKGALERCGSYYGVVWADCLQVMVLYERGDIEEAERLALASAALAGRTLGPASQGRNLLSMLHAQLCYEQNRIDDAWQLLAALPTIVAGRALGECAARAYLTKARILFLRGAAQAADRCLAEAAVAAAHIGMHRMSMLLRSERVHLCIKNGAIDKAIALGAGCSALPEPDSGAARRDAVDADIALQVVALRLAIASGQSPRARTLLGDLLMAARRLGRHHWLVRLHCIKAAMLCRDGARDDARRVLSAALLSASVCGLGRCLLDEDALIGELIQEILERRNLLDVQADGAPPVAYLMDLLHADGRAVRAVPASAAVAAPAMSVRRSNLLSKREVEILRLLSLGLRNRDVASQLFLTEATVKWHLGNIYLRLKVVNRTSAIATARSLQLL